jgi:hypothetical protein
MENQTREQLVKLVSTIVNAMYDLSELWDDEEVSDFFETVGNFPFSESFDEVAGNWNGWLFDIRDALKN